MKGRANKKTLIKPLSETLMLEIYTGHMICVQKVCSRGCLLAKSMDTTDGQKRKDRVRYAHVRVFVYQMERLTPGGDPPQKKFQVLYPKCDVYFG